MSQSLEDLLGNRSFNQPPEINIVKDFVEQKFKLRPEVSLTNNQIIITVKGSALAGALRPYLPQLKRALGDSTKRLQIRIK